ncbi:tRNA (adenosine(37)-N6)-threonylcarbamoyltransferase complex dimerization subunit type 1 TsaB [Aureibaculum sp. 2210JD6-5]|uniref:tRNA (adenosine(37)-N6)-threonylcarbamoyltransferase complex dimerization subunit type 1 TsaB n=1 Tax=Aureibaculum sp. 2210JD6-5 TaxID=3103957 RepID=UPI002AAEEA5C|nr:tRNA (adenosine(37)-N6)-threonylcarbamoyltransferase complex dimerization subunit type 1 TsaB [Aureibaculum sp. 2210JD6-5]MDY7396238.1 tRNA (adenosine(37)-N6)-threonylcarbamoyltransferase complex dimerization subunit type 1 TsaB [Aureibaculum sp. 2210JD6-5]
MSLILNIETTTKNCSVSLAEKGVLLTLEELNDGNYSHGEQLHLFIQKVLKDAQKYIKDIDAVAISKGPGSYTGLRIGVSTAKGLCFSLDKPLISISTLTSLANAISTDGNSVIVPLLDARRMEVYSAVFDNNLNQVRETKAEIISENSFSEYLSKGKVYFLGDGTEKCKSVIKVDNANFLDGYYPSARQMAKLSYNKYKKNDIEDVAYFEPFYLKDFMVTTPKNQP